MKDITPATFEDGESVAIYCRVSTDSEDQLNSLENQKSYFLRLIEEHNLKLYKTYADEGITGTSFKKRDAFNRMLHDAGIDVVKTIDRRTLKTKVEYAINKQRKPKFSKIFIKNTSRFARNVLSIEFVKMLRLNNVYIYFLDRSLLTVPENDLFLNLYFNFDEHDSRDKSIKVRFGFKEGAKKGMIYLGGGKLFGYDYHPKTNTLTKNADAKVVKLIFDMYTEDRLGIRVIANKLQAMGFKTAKGNSEWGKTTIRNILSNEKYAGKNPIQKYDAGMVLEDKHWSRVRDNYEVQDTDKIEPIITWEQFLKAKEIREGKVEVYNGQRTGRKNVYSRYTKLIKCSKCGSFYIRNTDYRSKKKRDEDKYYFYNCSGKKKRGIAFCDNVNVLETDLDEVIKKLSYGRLKKEVEQRLANLRSMLLIVCEFLSDDLDPTKNADAVDCRKELETETDVLTNMYKKLLTLDDENGIIKQMITEQEAKVSTLKEQLNAISSYNEDIIRQIEMLLDAYDESRTVAQGLKKRYSEDEILSMVECIYIDDAEYFDFGNINPTYKVLTQLEDLIRPYASKCKLNVENWQHAQIHTPEELEKIDRECYNKMRALVAQFYDV